MPQPVLRAVALILGLCALSSFSLAIWNAPGRGRLPGEQAPGQPAATAIQAMEATPLSQERIEGPPPPPVLTPEEQAKLDAEKKAKAEADAAARLAKLEADRAAATDPAAAAATPTLQVPTAPPEKTTPQPEEPIF